MCLVDTLDHFLLSALLFAGCAGSCLGTPRLDTAPDPAAAACTVDQPAAGTAASMATCTPLGDVSWELSVEWVYDHPWGIVGPPVAIRVGGAVDQVSIVAEAAFENVNGGSPQSVIEVSGRSGEPVHVTPKFADQHLPIAAGSSMNDDRSLSTAFAGVLASSEPGAGYRVLCIDADSLQTREFDGVDSATYNGSATSDVALSATDVNRDGRVDFANGKSIISAECELVAEPFGEAYIAYNIYPTVTFDAAGEPMLLNFDGIRWMNRRAFVPWDSHLYQTEYVRPAAFLAFVAHIEGEMAILGAADAGLFKADVNGVVTLYTPDSESYAWPSKVLAMGDATGDGLPDLCVQLDGFYHLRDLDFEVESELPTGGYLDTSACVMADLDADGRFEVILYGPGGLVIADGVSGDVLASTDEIVGTNSVASPIVADIDGDGSAEIVVPGHAKGETSDTHLYAIGPAKGRWARTRPVWNQHGYDITSVRDDGSIVSFPRPNWQTYNTFRAQPAHDGDRPDLAPRVVDVCIDTCAVGTYRVAVVVENLGSQPAPAGTEVVFSTWTDGDDGLTEVARLTIDEEIGPLMAAEALVFDIATSQWGDRRVVDVYGVHDDECDLVNDRIDVWDDPCPG